MQQTVTALFDDRSRATEAVQRLIELGISEDKIKVISNDGVSADAASLDDDRRPDEGGFWSALGDLFLPDDDRAVYSEGISRGGTTVSVRAEEAETSRAVEILEQYGAVDLDDREQAWRGEGWTGTAPSGATAEARRSLSGDASGDDDVIPVVEEELRIGKRQMNTGRVRVHSYMVETPVEENVSLREERVSVERRPVDRALSATEEDLFRDRVIEVEATSEQAVVSKQARVKEEIVVRKQADERVETVSDTVRTTKVDVEDDTGSERRARSRR